MELIAGDIGGTKCRLAWVTVGEAGTRQLRFEQEYPSSGFATADELIRRFVDDSGLRMLPDRLQLALPGPLSAQRAVLTNLDWILDAVDMQVSLGIPHVRFINDFQAAAAGVALLAADDVMALNPQPVELGGVRVVTGAGTGLGLAFMLPDECDGYRCHPSEGGHIDFAPADARQTRLLEKLRTRHGHVSWERAVSGLAMNDLYRFCQGETGAAGNEKPVDGTDLAALADAGDPSAEAALDLFTDLYGAWVGNVALLYQPHGGLYIAGGIAIHQRTRMQSPRFMAAATDKGRMRSVVERTPIFLVTHERLGVLGAIAAGLHPEPVLE